MFSRRGGERERVDARGKTTSVEKDLIEKC